MTRVRSIIIGQTGIFGSSVPAMRLKTDILLPCGLRADYEIAALAERCTEHSRWCNDDRVIAKCDSCFGPNAPV